MRKIVLIIMLSSFFLSAQGQKFSKSYLDTCKGIANCVPSFSEDYIENPANKVLFSLHGCPNLPFHLDDTCFKPLFKENAFLEKARRFGFESKEDASGLFNFVFLRYLPNNRLGYSHWVYIRDQIISGEHGTMEISKMIYYLPNHGTAIIENLDISVDANTIFLVTIDEIENLSIGQKISAEQHLILPQFNETQTNINMTTQYLIDNPYVFVHRIDDNPTWGIQNTTNSTITVNICATDSRKIEENREYGYTSLSGCVVFPIEWMVYENTRLPNCMRQLEPNSSQNFGQSIFQEMKNFHQTRLFESKSSNPLDQSALPEKGNPRYTDVRHDF